MTDQQEKIFKDKPGHKHFTTLQITLFEKKEIEKERHGCRVCNV